MPRNPADAVTYDDWEGFSDSAAPDESTASEQAEEDSSSDEDVFSDEEINGTIPIYPEGGALADDGTFEFAATVQELQNAINRHGKKHGYAVIRRQGRKKVNGSFTRWGIFCDRHGDPRPSEGTGLRKTASRKCGCQFQGIASLSEAGWVFQHSDDPAHHTHNHGPSLDPAAHTQHRKMKSPVKAYVNKFSAYTAIRAREIAEMVAQEHPDSHYTTKDINNARQLARRLERDGCSASGALIKAFDEEGVQYIAKWADDNPDRLVAIMFTFEPCQKAWLRFSDILCMDNTYSTNGLGFPLFVVTTQTNIKSTMPVAFGLVDNERREGFDFLAESLEDLRVKIGARRPAVLLTDKDDRMRDAFAAVYPDAQLQICRFHIHKNVLLQAKKKGRWPRPPPPPDDAPGSQEERQLRAV
jgi:hypothetical protein